MTEKTVKQLIEADYHRLGMHDFSGLEDYIDYAYNMYVNLITSYDMTAASKEDWLATKTVETHLWL